MIKVTDNFKTAMKQPIKELDAYINTSSSKITSGDDLVSFKISCEAGLCKTAMRKLEAKFIGDYNLLGQEVNVGFGVRLEDNTFEYLDYGTFLITQITLNKDTGTTSIVGYDKMINTMKEYKKLEIEYPIKLLDYTRLMCNICGLDLENDYFGKNIQPYSINEITEKALYQLSEYENNGEEIIIYSNLTATKDTAWRISTPIFKVPKNTDLYISFDIYYTGAESGHIELGDVDFTGNWKTGLVNSNGEYLERITQNNTSYFEKDKWNRISICYNSGENENVAIRIATDSPNLWSTEGNSYVKIKNIMLSTELITSYAPYNPMNDWEITQELWENIDGITYRDILVQIAQVTGTTCIINNDNKVYFKPINKTGEQLTYDNMKKLKLEPKYGEINSVILSRTPQEDNIFERDEESIEANGLTEFKIENNEIVDKDRDSAMLPIYNSLHGINFYPFETSTEGLGWYEIGDQLDIVNDKGDIFNCSVFNFSISIDGGIKETLKATAETKTQTQYQYATTIAKRVKNTEIIVNKQEQYIEQLVTDMYEEDGIIHENFTKTYQDIQNIINSVQNSGGSNLIKNSVMFAYDNDGNPNNWETEGDGTLEINSSAEASSNGSLSGHVFILNNKTVRQRVTVKIDDEDIPADQKTYYTFSTKIKKGAVGSCYVKMYNSNEEYIIELKSGETAFYKEFEIKELLPKDTYYDVEFYGSADSEAVFTDSMLAVGSYKSQWQQASGEIMNTQVNINLDGILVKSSVYLGDYTVMSPLEFAGYSNINGTITKVFSLNKDTTKVKKLEAEDEVKMLPIKIVPIKSGTMQGWAFVPST